MTTPPVNAGQFSDYIAHVRQQKLDYHQHMNQRQQTGLVQAKSASDLLKQHFGVKEVFLFGSLLCPERVHPESDVDLAVWGLSTHRYCEAMGTLLCTVKGFSVDLIMMETAPSSLLDCVLSQGVRL
jgi:predicted nucleotidyltransferase